MLTLIKITCCNKYANVQNYQQSSQAWKFGPWSTWGPRACCWTTL